MCIRDSSTPKQATRRLLRFVTEVNCFARMKTNNRLPWGTDQDEGAEGSQARTYREKWLRFADCLAGLYQAKYVRLLSPDSVGDSETDVFCVPMELFAFRQVEWPISLYFPISRNCPGTMLPTILEAVTIFRSNVIERVALADGSVDAEDISRTRKGKKELG